MIDFSKFTDFVTPEEEDNHVRLTNSNTDTIEWLTEKKYYGHIPEPIPANKVLPDWYRNLDGKLGKGLNKSTVKRCMPFLDALSMGWIIPTPCELEVRYEDGQVDLEWSFDQQPLEFHNPEQIGGSEHPFGNMGIMKWLNFWAAKVPEGYSILVTSPLNRVEPRWQTFSGVVDADNYFTYVNVPFAWTGGNYHDVIEAGTPVAQVIPFKRDAIIGDGVIRSLTDEEFDELNGERMGLQVEESMYRNQRWQPKNQARVVERE